MKRKQLTALILSGIIISSPLTYGEIANATNNTVSSTYSQNYNKTNSQKGICNGKIAIKNINGNIIGYSNPYDMLVILSKEGNLYNVVTQYGLKGYINSNSFETVKSGLNDKLVKLNEKGYVVNVTTCLNVRNKATINSSILDTLDNGVNFNIIGKQGSWYKINYNGKEGFVYSTFVKEGENNSTVDVDSSNVNNIKSSSNINNKNNISSSKTINSSISSHKDINKETNTISSEKNNNLKHNSKKIDSNTSQKENPVVKSSKDKGHNTVVTQNNPTTKPTEKPQQAKPVVKHIKEKPIVKVNNAPVLKANNITLTQGEKFTDSMLKATAMDKEDGNLTGSIIYTGHVNTEVPGKYTIYLSVKDSQGAIAKTSVTVIVKAKETKPIKPATPDKEQNSDKTQPNKPNTNPTKPVIKPQMLNNAPQITGHNVTINQGSKFSLDMLGIKATDKEDGNLTNDVKVLENNVNTAKAGNYEVVVKVTDKQGASCKATFKVTVKEVVKPAVIDSVPVIEGHDVTINEGETFNVASLGLKATDKEDGNITASIKVVENNVNTSKAGTYTVKVQVQDKQGAKVTKIFNVTVKAKEVVKPSKPVVKPQVINACPEITGHDVTINQGTMFSDNMLGLSAFDKEDGNLTKDIKVTGNVNVDVAGTYKVTATVQDKQGAKATKTFTVTVKKVVKPVVMDSAPTLEGHDVTINQGDKFSNDMLGVTANDKEDGNLTKEVKFSGTVNTNEVGTYKVTAKVTDKQGASCTKTFTVTVKQAPNTAPVITAKDSVSLPFGTHWKLSDSDVKVMDKEDGNITNSVIVTGSVNARVPGTYHLTLTARDKQGAKTTKDITVKILAKAPTIEAHSITLTQGQKFSKSMLGLEAKDCTGKNITDKIVMHGTVNTNEVGTHSIRFTVEDQYGLSASKTITVTIKAKPVEGWTANSEAFHEAVAQKMYQLVNQLRKENGVAPLGISEEAVRAANWKSQDMLTRHYFEHKTPEGKDTWDHPGFNDVEQENIAQNWMQKTTGLTKKDADELAEDLYTLWYNSKGHRDAMLDDWNTKIGFGFAVDMKTGLVDATQDFTAQ